MQKIEEEVQRGLFALQDLTYRDFQCKLMPTVDPETVIGVRTPALRKFARAFCKTPQAADYIRILPHRYYEENNLHGFVIETIKEYESCIAAVDAFLPYVDNWATCDLVSPKVFSKHLPELLKKIKSWIASGETYTVRFGIGMLMSHYLGEHFEPGMLRMVAAVRSEEYYVNMMVAWYFATALAKQWDAALPYIKERRLEKWTHNKTIQKAVESYRIGSEEKALLRALKQK
jgi:3-methyladenine DNA glycosylase AlkD